MGSLLATAMGVASTANARTVVDFEGIDSAGLVDGYGYGGLSGGEFVGQLSGYSPYEPHAPELGDSRLHAWGDGALRFDQAPVIFEGMHYISWGSDTNVSFSLYYQDRLVHSEPLDLSNQPQNIYWLASGYSGLVDKILLHRQGSDGFLVDNLTYSTAAPAPLPGAIWLFGGGLAGLLSYAKRRKTR